MLGQIVFGLVLIGVGLLYFLLPRKPGVPTQAEAWQRLPERHRPYAPVAMPSGEWVIVIVIGIGIWLIVSAVV